MSVSNTKATATSQMMRMNKREYRARNLSSYIMNKIYDALIAADQEHRSLPRFVENALLETFMTKGIDIVSDYERQEYGLPPRDEYGYTLEELHALEEKKLELMRRPMPSIINIDMKTRCPECGAKHNV